MTLPFEQQQESESNRSKLRIIKAMGDFIAGRKRGRGINRVPKILEKQRKFNGG